MALTESTSSDSDRSVTGRPGNPSRGPFGASAAGRIEACDLAATTRGAVDRAGIDQMRDALSTPAGRGVLRNAAAQLAPAAGNPVPAGVAGTVEALAARSGIAAAGAMGVVAGAAALAVLPTNTAPAHLVGIAPDLRVSFPFDSIVGRVEFRVDGRWRDTGVEATLTPYGLSAEMRALETRVGPLDDAAQGAFINERRNRLGLAALDALSYRARAALQIETLPGNWQAHHLVPFDVVDTLSPGLQQAMAASGWAMDARANLVALPRDWATFDANMGALPMHNGPHPGYSGDVRDLLTPLEARYQDMSAEELKRALEQISDHMRRGILELKYHVTVR